MSDMKVAPIGAFTGPQETARVESKTTEKQRGFGQWLNDSIAQVNQLQQNADAAANALVTGQSRDIHGAMIAMQKSSVTMDLVVNVRNKVIAAYDEIKRMQF
ncbi:MAG: flagellar hook-basal body complex protein FliE [Desulfatitalea sp.]|nr:flagellar hook-basal body complex protein FliE [Desulfatitalea sp.]NNJ99871.1 flagellar hook-basal body complex protein FliE [Desulfatitalea sp.]